MKNAIDPLVEFIASNKPEDVALAITEFIMQTANDMHQVRVHPDTVIFILQMNSWKYFGVSPIIQFHTGKRPEEKAINADSALK
jgi:hypothetical protein